MENLTQVPFRNIIIAGISGGIGRALADKLLAQDGQVRIWGLCRNPAALSEEKTWAESQARRVQLAAWDAGSTDQDGLQRTLSEVLPKDLAVDTFIYAAGVLHGEKLFPEKRLDEVRAEALLHAYQINAVGFAMLAQALQPWLRHGGFKRVAAISAKVGSLGDNRMGGWYAYRASKSALNMLVRNLAIELPRRHRPIACAALHPGTTQTALSKPFARSLAQLSVREPSETADNLIRVMAGMTESDNGRFINWDGADLPW